MLDLLIQGGLVIDGTGSPGYFAAIGVEGDTVRILRSDASSVEAVETIDATGKVVCPGFIDLHCHTGLTILGEPLHEPKVRQGVTTELVGIDGISHAPFKTQEELHRYIWLDAGLNGYPPLPADWLTVAEQLGKYDNQVSVNVAFILGNSPVRIWGVGWNDRPATGSELEEMKAVTREAMEEGAWGLSTGLDYPPGAYADTDELAALMETVARFGGFYHTHTRTDLKKVNLLAPWDEALDIGRRSGGAVHLTHYRQSTQGEGSHWDYLDLVDDARGQGMDVTFDCYTYPYSGTSATIAIPNWAKDGGPEALMAALQDPEARARMKKEISPVRLEESWLTHFTQPQNKIYEGHRPVDIAELRGNDPAETFFDLLVEERLGVSIVGLGTNPQTLPDFVSHPCGMIASDAILVGGVSESAQLRLLSGGARGVRASGAASAAAGSHTENDVLPRAADGHTRPGAAHRRNAGRHRRVRPEDGEGSGHEAASQAVSGGNRLRHCQREGGGAGIGAHGGASGTRHSPRQG